MHKLVKTILPLASLREWARKHLYQRAKNRILVLGDSHVRVFEDWRFLWRFPRTRFDVVYVPGGTASGIGNRASKTGAYSRFLAALDRQEHNWVLVNLGEVDTAYTLWMRAQASGKSVQDLMAAAVKSYCAFLHEVKQRHTVVVLSACLPTLAEHADSKDEVAKVRTAVVASQHARTALTLDFNARIAEFCAQQAIPYLNCAEAALGPHGIVRDAWVNQKQHDHHYQRATYARWLVTELRGFVSAQDRNLIPIPGLGDASTGPSTSKSGKALIHLEKRLLCVGFRRWKAANIKPMLSLFPERVHFVSDSEAAALLAPTPADALVFWGRTPPQGLAELAQRCGARLLRMEDGFVRSVGLGSDLIRPLSLVLDESGIYFDPTQTSDLERILNTASFSDAELAQAGEVRAFMVQHGITKYNLEPREPADWQKQGKLVVLVPGQVEDDASIRFGCTDVKTNLGLLQEARRAHPDAFVVYKPHPDVMSGNRAGKLALAQAREFADHVEARLSIVSCLDACDVVHTMTSLTGFDALLRGKRVVVYGQPFYAGWGLTQDVLKEGAAFARRERRLTLDALVAGALLRYPIYWDWDLKGYTTCAAVLHRLLETRTALEANGGLEKLRVGYVRRQLRKARILWQARMVSGLK